jgi:hypothetical protein
MSHRLKITQLTQILAIKDMQALDAKMRLAQAKSDTEISSAAELQARDHLTTSVDAWNKSLKSAAPDLVLLRFQGSQITTHDDQHRRTVETLEEAHRGVKRLTLAFGSLNIELGWASNQLRKAKSKQLKRDAEKALSHLEDRTTFDMVMS